jgi:hypothetical protein
MTTAQDSLDVVLVPVPVHLLGEVYRVLGSAMTPPPGERDLGTKVNVPPGAWSDAMVRRLRSVLHLEGVRALLDSLAEIAPIELPMTEVADRANIPSDRLRGQLAAFTKLCKKSFDTATWPIGIRYDDMGKAFYSMSEHIAAWWLDNGQRDPLDNQTR